MKRCPPHDPNLFLFILANKHFKRFRIIDVSPTFLLNFYSGFVLRKLTFKLSLGCFLQEAFHDLFFRNNMFHRLIETDSAC